MTSVLNVFERAALQELAKFSATQARDQRGRWTSGGGLLHGGSTTMAGSRDDLQRHLVDYKADEGRDLTGPGTSNITDLGGAGTTRYVDVPGLDQLHGAMGYGPVNPVTTSTDMDSYVEQRNATFKSQGQVDVPISDITWTQPRVNDAKVQKLVDKIRSDPSWDWSKAGVFVLSQGGKNYLLNGHHRVAAAAASGRKTYPAYVFHAQ